MLYYNAIDPSIRNLNRLIFFLVYVYKLWIVPMWRQKKWSRIYNYLSTLVQNRPMKWPNKKKMCLIHDPCLVLIYLTFFLTSIYRTTYNCSFCSCKENKTLNRSNPIKLRGFLIFLPFDAVLITLCYAKNSLLIFIYNITYILHSNLVFILSLWLSLD